MCFSVSTCSLSCNPFYILFRLDMSHIVCTVWYVCESELVVCLWVWVSLWIHIRQYVCMLSFLYLVFFMDSFFLCFSCVLISLFFLCLLLLYIDCRVTVISFWCCDVHRFDTFYFYLHVELRLFMSVGVKTCVSKKT